MQTMMRDLRILWRAERIVAESQLRLAFRRTALAAAALLVAVLALGMLNLAGYLALAPVWGAAWAAFALAAVDLIVAGIVVAVALSARPGPEHEAAVELRDLSMKELGNDLGSSKSPLGALMRPGDGLETLLPVVLMPLLTAAFRAVKNKVAD